LEDGAYERFASFIEQDYPGRLEVVFAVEGDSDPAIPIIAGLQEAYPDRDIQLVQSKPHRRATGKTNNVIAAHSAATGEICISADVDVLANPDDISRLVAHIISDDRIGVASAFPVYRDLVNCGRGFTAVYIELFLLALYGLLAIIRRERVFPGTYYAVRSSALQSIGGWERIADNVADDVTLGEALWRAGHRSVVTPVHANVYDSNKTLRSWWQRQCRWHLTYRATMPLAVYLLEPLAHPALLALALPLLFSLAGLPATHGAIALGIYLAVRWMIIGWANVVFLEEPTLWRWLIALPLVEVLLTLTWGQALFRTELAWGGVTYQVETGGSVTRTKNDTSKAPHAA
jgi:ceramide glucosyltransferase